MIYYNARKWRKVEGGYVPIDGTKTFISELLMRRYLINRYAHQITENSLEPKAFKCTQLILSI